MDSEFCIVFKADKRNYQSVLAIVCGDFFFFPVCLILPFTLPLAWLKQNKMSGLS